MSGDRNKTNGAADPGAASQEAAKPESGGQVGQSATKTEPDSPERKETAADKAKQAKAGKKPAQRKARKRGVRAKPKTPPAAAAAKPAEKKPPEKKASEDEAKPEPDKAVASTPSKPADTQKQASDKAGSSRSPGPDAKSAKDKETGAEDNRAEQRSHVPWLLIAVTILVLSGGLWGWGEYGSHLTKFIGLQPSETGAKRPADAQREAVDLPVPPPLRLAEVKELEELLAQLGLQPGEVDGLIDDSSRGAIREVQQMMEMPVDGEPSEELLEVLRDVAGYQERSG